MTANKKVKTGLSVGLLILLGLAVFSYFNFTTVVVSGNSMEPTFANGRRLLASSAYFLVGGIKKNDIVVIRGTKGEDYMIKRVYRTEGEKVEWVFAPENYPVDGPEFVVPNGTVFVLGDNRVVSEDSRKYGPIPLSRIIGKVVVR